MTAPSIRGRDGYALPLTIFLVSLLSVLLVAAFTQVQAERRVADSSGASLTARDLAHAGLESYMGSATAQPPDGDSVRVNLVNGYADVGAHVVQAAGPATLLQTYILRSTGYVIEPTQGADPRASRTVAHFAQWQTATINPLASFAAINRVNRIGGGNGEFRGNDACSGNQVSAIRVPTGGNPDVSGYAVSGSAPLVNEQDTPAVVASQTAVDWAAAISDGIIPDYDSIMLWDFSYPVTRVQGDATINSAGFMVFGTGLLIVTGDLTTSGNRVYWDGIILVGGKINFNASRTYFDGAVISGSNELLPGPAPPAGTIGPQFKTSITTRAR